MNAPKPNGFTARYLFFLFALSISLQSCAPVPMVMQYDPGGTPAERPVWPSAPETPRFIYNGQLVGESNFRPVDASTQSSGRQIFRWLVGLGGDERSMARQLVRPQTGVVDLDGRIYVTDVGRKAVFVFDEAKGELHIWDRVDEFTPFESPVGIVLGAAQEILVADASLGRIVRLSKITGAGKGSFGEKVLQRPTGMARDETSGTIFVADTGAHNIKVFNDRGELMRVLGRGGDGPGQFNAPTHLSYRNGLLYVSDTLNARVQTMDAYGKVVNTIGQRGLYVGNLTRPKGVAVDSDDHVYVVESYYDHLIVYDRTGQYLLPIGGSGVEIGKFFLPSGVWIDERGRIFIADMFNGRVIILQYLGI